MTKYIFITGGVVSGLGKGIAAASIGLILKSRGLKVVNQKFDPYLNIDPGTMNPVRPMGCTRSAHRSSMTAYRLPQAEQE